MVGYLSQVQSQLEGDLKIISLEESNHLLVAKKSLAVIHECCRKLSTVRLQCDFKSKEEEVYFFKGLKCYYYNHSVERSRKTIWYYYFSPDKK